MTTAKTGNHSRVKIALVIGSIRTPRKADSVLAWIEKAIEPESGVEFEVLDLKELDLPPLTHFNQHSDQDASPDLVRWRDSVAEAEGFIFITPEYNRAAPGYFKNAFDLLDVQWKNKPVGFISYGGVGGARAVDQWRTSMAAYNMHCLGTQVLLYNRFDFESDTLQPTQRHDQTLLRMIAELEKLCLRLRD